MPKGNPKSSATSATRRKHAKRAVGPSPPEEQPLSKDKKLTKQQRAQKKKEPRAKSYIPPVKPQPVQPDPLETTGLAHRLPPDLVIVLRSFSKKAHATKIRALEELQTSWINKAVEEDEDGDLRYALVDLLPVWLHHLPALFTHASRRIRFLTAGVHGSLLKLSMVNDSFLRFLRESASSSQLENILGTWYMAANDVDKVVASTVLKSWNETFTFEAQPPKLKLDDHFLQPILTFLKRVVLDPDGTHLALNPPQPVSATVTPKKGARRENPEPAPSSRSKADELEEDPQDRNARLRIGSLGAVRLLLESPISNSLSEETMLLLANPALWSSLHHAQHGLFPELVNFGYGQPNVRKIAWLLLQTILERKRGIVHIDPLVPVLSPAILRSAWVEPDTNVQTAMWQPMLRFLKDFPHAWEVERSEAEDADEDQDEEEDTEDVEVTPSTATMTHSAAYREFLQFLEKGCSGSPVEGYPTIVIILSTIPSPIFASSSNADLFGSFWKALDSRALSSLHRSTTSAAFLSSLLECMVFFVKRIRDNSGNGGGNSLLLQGLNLENGQEEAVRDLVCSQLRILWENLADNGTLRVEPRAAARLVAHTLISLHEVDAALFGSTWTAFASLLREAIRSNPLIASVFMKVLHDKFKNFDGPLARVNLLMSEALHDSAQGIFCLSSLDERGTYEHDSRNGVPFLVDMLDQFREGIFQDSTFSDLVDTATEKDAFTVLKAYPAFILGYLTYRKDETRCSRVWQALLSAIAEHANEAEQLIAPLFGAVQRGTLPSYLKPQAGELDNFFGLFLAQVLAGDSIHLSFVRSILVSPDYFLSQSGFASAFIHITESFSHHVSLALKNDQDFNVSVCGVCLELVSSLIDRPRSDLPQPDFTVVLPDVFMMSYLVPEFKEEETWRGLSDRAGSTWTLWGTNASEEEKHTGLTYVKSRLRILLRSTEVHPSAHDVLQTLSRPPKRLPFAALDLFPSKRDLDNLLDELPSDATHPSLACVDPLVPTVSELPSRLPGQAFDLRGFSAYSRIIEALLQVFFVDRRVLKDNIWALRHFSALKILALDFLRVPYAANPVFGPGVSVSGLESLVSKIDQIMTYVLTLSSEDGWHLQVLDVALGKVDVDGMNSLSCLLVNLLDAARTNDDVKNVRILWNVLRHVLHDVDQFEGDLWMSLARKIESKAPRTSMAIVRIIARLGLESQPLDRYRNELAASLLGIPAQKANSEGLLALTKLAASAPPSESEVIFLSQQRAINVMKVCQRWIASDDVEISEDVEGVMTEVFLDLAPILQDVTGSHWDLIFDVIENNLENASLAEDMTLVTLARSLRLVVLILDLALTNKSLQATWEERKLPILELVKDIAATSIDISKKSVPRSVCRGLILLITQSLPSSLIDQDTLAKMVHLITDSTLDNQKMAYQFLRNAARKRTEYFVIEAGVDAETTFTAELPLEMLSLLQCTVTPEDQRSEAVVGTLLAWMLLFDLFKDASLKVRMSYIEQLQKLDIVNLYFLPSIIDILQLNEGPPKAFKLDIWAVDEFFVEFLDEKLDFSIPVLAAHVYYRSLRTIPSLIHNWVLDCKDRQLSSSIIPYTSQYFSSVLIHAELATLKSPEAIETLADDSLSIKVASSVNEVMASYSLDEHRLEIKLKIPSDWPLHKIEVKDVKRVGVDETRWRAWILAAQQIIWSHNGTLVDALSLFKKNLTLHFEGQVECAICYSIISVMDGSLPKTPCRTCKNRFHAWCLYKWFKTSHASSCPICRSDIL